MSTLSFPFTITHDTLADAAQVQSNFSAVSTVVNGNLEAATNAKVGNPSPLTGSAIAGGGSSNLCRADHVHTVQCLEVLASDPSSGNFVRRMYVNSATNKVRMCTATGGSGTWITVANYDATDIPAHQGTHFPNGSGTDLFDGPACMATRTSNQTFGTSGTWATMNFNSADLYDTDTMHDTVTNNARITFTHAGVYRVRANLAWAAGGSGDRAAIIQVNSGGAVGASNVTIAGLYTVGSGINPFISLEGTYKAAAADYVELFAVQASGGSLVMLGSGSLLNASIGLAPCYFSAEWIGTGV